MHVRRGKDVYLRELKASDVVEPATEGDKQNTDPQSMDYPNRLPLKWTTSKVIFPMSTLTSCKLLYLACFVHKVDE